MRNHAACNSAARRLPRGRGRKCMAGRRYVWLSVANKAFRSCWNQGVLRGMQLEHGALASVLWDECPSHEAASRSGEHQVSRAQGRACDRYRSGHAKVDMQCAWFVGQQDKVHHIRNQNLAGSSLESQLTEAKRLVGTASGRTCGYRKGVVAGTGSAQHPWPAGSRWHMCLCRRALSTAWEARRALCRIGAAPRLGALLQRRGTGTDLLLIKLMVELPHTCSGKISGKRQESQGGLVGQGGR